MFFQHSVHWKHKILSTHRSEFSWNVLVFVLAPLMPETKINKMKFLLHHFTIYPFVFFLLLLVTSLDVVHWCCAPRKFLHSKNVDPCQLNGSGISSHHDPCVYLTWCSSFGEPLVDALLPFRAWTRGQKNLRKRFLDGKGKVSHSLCAISNKIIKCNVV